MDEIRDILSNLGLHDTVLNEIINTLITLKKTHKLEINIKDNLVKELESADEKLKEFLSNIELDNNTKYKIQNLYKELAYLQGKILLRKIYQDPNKIISTLTDAMTAKIKAVNNIIDDNLKNSNIPSSSSSSSSSSSNGNIKEVKEEEEKKETPLESFTPFSIDSSQVKSSKYYNKYIKYKHKYLALKNNF